MPSQQPVATAPSRTVRPAHAPTGPALPPPSRISAVATPSWCGASTGWAARPTNSWACWSASSALIEAHLPDMLRVALSIRTGRLLPSAILRRLATYSRKNRLYFAFRELGRAVRTDFLLRYLSSIKLRRAIGTAKNKSELFNRYAQWVAFGSNGLATAAERDEQRKMVKYNHLVANLLIFHTAVGMTRALDEIAAEGHGAAITPEALAGTSPYLNAILFTLRSGWRWRHRSTLSAVGCEGAADSRSSCV